MTEYVIFINLRFRSSVMSDSGSNHVPGLHDPVAKAALLKKTNEDMRQRIQELKSGLEKERNRSNQTHREKVQEIRELRDVAEVK